jgi:hypothetical protein
VVRQQNSSICSGVNGERSVEVCGAGVAEVLSRGVFVLQLHHRKHDQDDNPALHPQRHVKMQVHAVPDAERAFDSQGRRLPWGLEYAE